MGVWLWFTGGSHLRQIFWEHENLSDLWVIRFISTLQYTNYTKIFWAKIQIKQESSLTTVWLNWDPPIYGRMWSSLFLILVIFSRKNDANLSGKLSSGGKGFFFCLVPVRLFTRLKIFLALPLNDLMRSLMDSLFADCNSLI